MKRRVQAWLGVTTLLALLASATPPSLAQDRPAAPMENGTYVYAAVPGVGSDMKKGGDGVVVFDADHDFRFVKRIALPTLRGRPPEIAKGIVASVATGMLYVTETNRLIALDLASDRLLWMQAYDGWCCDRPDISPDNQILYVPALDHPAWNIVSSLNGQLIATLPMPARGHNTIFSPHGDRVYLSPESATLFVADARRNTVVGEIGPFSARVRPFVINAAETLVFASINQLLGVGVGDLRTGKVLYEVRAPEQFPCLRNPDHGTCAHGMALTPDESEVWVADGNSWMHIFDATRMPPVYKTSLVARTSVTWLTCSIDGKRLYPSSGDVVDIASKRTIGALTDEKGRALESEKLLEVKFAGGKPVAVGDQWCNGRGGASH
jgi:hypothetical protein